MNRKTASHNAVLLGVLKSRRDRSILLRERWYRIPLARAPRRPFTYIALYQPAAFGREGKRIRYYARILNRRVVTRRDLLPDEPRHVRAGVPYLRLGLGPIRKLPRPIRNASPRRVSFGFTTLKRLTTARDLLELYGVAPTEDIMRRVLARAGIRAAPQYAVSCGGKPFDKLRVKHYRLDFAILCRGGRIAIECDNRRAHAGKRQRARDRAKDAALRRQRWTILRLSEQDIVSRPEACVLRVRRAIRRLDTPVL